MAYPKGLEQYQCVEVFESSVNSFLILYPQNSGIGVCTLISWQWPRQTRDKFLERQIDDDANVFKRAVHATPALRLSPQAWAAIYTRRDTYLFDKARYGLRNVTRLDRDRPIYFRPNTDGTELAKVGLRRRSSRSGMCQHDGHGSLTSRISVCKNGTQRLYQGSSAL